MSFSMLAPAALGLAVLGVLPILAHMARQVPRDRQAFGAMLLLQRVVKRLRRRRRVKDLPLLLLRLLGLLAVVFAATGSRLSFPGGSPEVGGSGRVVLVVDRSMSMSAIDGSASALQRAREEAMGVLGGLPDGVQVGLVAYDDAAVQVTPQLTADHDRVAAALADLAPTFGASDLRGGLLEARRLLAGEPGELVVFSDEAGPSQVAEARAELDALVAAGSSVDPRRVGPDVPRNVGLRAASYGDGLEGGQVTVRLMNYGKAPMEVPCEVLLPDGASIPIFADLPPEGEAEERITVPREARGGVGEVRCEDPDLPADDARYFHLPTVGASRVLVVDGDPGDTPIRSEVYFLERALAPWGGAQSGLTLDITTPAGLLELDPEVHRVVFLANVADPRPFGPRLTEFVRQGGAVVVAGGDNVTADRYNSSLGGILPARLRSSRALAADGEEGIALALPDLDQEVFAPFRRGGRGAFAKVRTHTALTFDDLTPSEDVRVLLAWENGIPALVERRIGNGRVLVWTSTFDLGWGNLPLQAVFMPLAQRMVGWLGGEAGAGAMRIDAEVGRQVAIPLPDLALEPQVFGPDGDPVRSRIESARLLFVPDVPGAYQVQVESAPTMAWVAVNTLPEESDVRRADDLLTIQRELDPERMLQHLDLSRWGWAVGLVGFALTALWSARGTAS